MTTMRHRMQAALNRLPAIDPIKLHVGVSDRASDAMMMGAREALRYFLLGTTDAPPELLKALQDLDVAADADGVRAGETIAATLDEAHVAPSRYAEIWYLWAGKLTETQPTGGRYVVGAGLAPTDNDTTLRMQIHAVLATAAICGLTYENKAWKPVAVRPELCDFLMPGGLCVHMRAERAEVVSDIAREARDTLPRIALAAPGKSNEQVVSLATRTEEE